MVCRARISHLSFHKYLSQIYYFNFEVFAAKQGFNASIKFFEKCCEDCMKHVVIILYCRKK